MARLVRWSPEQWDTRAHTIAVDQVRHVVHLSVQVIVQNVEIRAEEMWVALPANSRRGQFESAHAVTLASACSNQGPRI